MRVSEAVKCGSMTVAAAKRKLNIKDFTEKAAQRSSFFKMFVISVRQRLCIRLSLIIDCNDSTLESRPDDRRARVMSEREKESKACHQRPGTHAHQAHQRELLHINCHCCSRARTHPLHCIAYDTGLSLSLSQPLPVTIRFHLLTEEQATAPGDKC